MGATVKLYLERVAGEGQTQGSRTIGLFKLLQEWTEGPTGNPNVPGGGQGDPAQAGDVTWNEASFPSPAWVTPGGQFDPNASDKRTIIAFNLNQLYTWSSAALAADVRSWVSDSHTNHGWMLKNDDESAARSFLAFWSKDGAAANPTLNVTPQLVVTYTVCETKACDPKRSAAE
jgi:hypothetical protein